MSKSLNLIKYLLYAGIFAEFHFWYFYRFQLNVFPLHNGKNFSFRIIVEVMTALWLILMLFDARYKPRKSWVLAMLAIFVGVVALSSIFGENFYQASGLITKEWKDWSLISILFAYFLVLAGMLKTEKVWNWLFNTSLFASVIIAFYGVFQLLGILQTHQGSRLDATLGNASYLAVYMVFHIFFGDGAFLPGARFQKMDLFFRHRFGIVRSLPHGDQRRDTGHNRRLFNRLALDCRSVSQQKIKIGNIFFIGGDGNNHRRFFLFLKTADFVKNSAVLTRFAGISMTEGTTESRLTIWKMGWQGFKEKPVFGWGQENFNLVFNKYYEPILYKQEPWFDRVHNVFFDRLTTNGIFGLLSYLGLLGVALYYLWAKRRKTGLSVEDSAVFGEYVFGLLFQQLICF